ncbi:indolethylamine N-methyltransferase-like [Bombina bombina]|uniref:indolethylamine N-methyltransferase-like n=1 Tax=Bombina bombina TaxID=8345 RepID=UPI00235AB019|nr:indolethylamine N-methyltransferase-like [Bombina bombina]
MGIIISGSTKVGKQYISTAEKASGMMVTKEEILSKQNLIFLCHIKGETLISIPIATVIYPLIPLAEFFNDITVLEMNDVCIKELEKWINTHDEAYDWSHAFNLIAEQEVKSEEWKKREETFKTSVKRILKYDLTKENPTDPVTLPKVDCLYVGCSLEVACKDQDDYIMSMKKISRWLKPGGHLIMYVLFNATFFTVGEHRFRILTLNEEFLKKTLMDIGYEIQTIEMVENKSKHEALNYEHLALITAVMQ